MKNYNANTRRKKSLTYSSSGEAAVQQSVNSPLLKSPKPHGACRGEVLGTINLGRCLLAVDVENGEVLPFDEEAVVPDPDGWMRAEPKQEDVMAVEFLLGTPDPPNNNFERWLQKLADARWSHKRYKQWKVYGGEAP